MTISHIATFDHGTYSMGTQQKEDPLKKSKANFAFNDPPASTSPINKTPGIFR